MNEDTGEFVDEVIDDPFGPENASMLNFIMQARIYDVLLAILSKQDRKLSEEILKAHSNGGIVGPMPSFSGNFIFDEINSEEQTTGD